MMYGCGDDPSPLPESVDVVEDAVADFIAAVGRRAVAGGGGSAAPPLGARLQPEDVLFLVRKDAKLFGRCTELLALADDIAAAKKAFDEVGE